MDRDRPSAWILVRFGEHLRRWFDRERPDEADRLRVADWIIAREADPYQGVRRELTIPDLWYGRIPGTVDASMKVVVCSYFVDEQLKIIRCDGIGRIGLPV